MRHTCENLKKFGLISDIDIVVRKDENASVGQLILFDNKKRIGMGVVIWYCPFCKKRLKQEV